MILRSEADENSGADVCNIRRSIYLVLSLNRVLLHRSSQLSNSRPWGSNSRVLGDIGLTYHSYKSTAVDVKSKNGKPVFSVVINVAFTVLILLVRPWTPCYVCDVGLGLECILTDT